MECIGVKGDLWTIAQKKMVVSLSEIGGLKKIRWSLSRNATTTTLDILSVVSGRQRAMDAYMYNEPKVSPPVTSPTTKKLVFPTAAAQALVDVVQLARASNVIWVDLSTRMASMSRALIVIQEYLRI